MQPGAIAIIEVLKREKEQTVSSLKISFQDINEPLNMHVWMKSEAIQRNTCIYVSLKSTY